MNTDLTHARSGRQSRIPSQSNRPSQTALFAGNARPQFSGWNDPDDRVELSVSGGTATFSVAKANPAAEVDAEEVKAAIFAEIHARHVKSTDRPKGTLICSDWDGTLQGSAQHVPDSDTLAICTGRSLVDMKRETIEQRGIRLRGVRLPYLSLQNGTLLFKNDTGMPADQWISQLSMEDCDPEYSEIVEGITGWNHQKVISILRDLKREDDRMHFFYPDGAEFMYYGANGKKKADEVIQILRKHGILARYEIEHGNFYKFAPLGVDKSTAAEYLACLENPEAVRTAGDGDNDKGLLATRKYNGVDNTPVMVGRKLRDDPEIASHPRLVRVFHGQVGSTLAALEDGTFIADEPDWPDETAFMPPIVFTLPEEAPQRQRSGSRWGWLFDFGKTDK